MISEKTCREETLEAVQSVINTKGQNIFLVNEVIKFMKQKGTKFADSTIKTHIVSRCCRNAPSNHGVTYKDFEKVGRGVYKLV